MVNLSKQDILNIGQDALRKNKAKLHGPAGSYPTSYGHIYQDGKPWFKLNQACLGQLDLGVHYAGVQEGRVGFFIFHQAEDTVKNRNYLKFILSETESPWREIVRRQEPQDFDTVFNYGYVLTDLEFASNFFINFMMAFRLSYEKPYEIDFWDQLIQDGVTKTTAAFCTAMWLGTKFSKDSPMSLVGDTGHSAYSPTYCDLETVNRLYHGKPYQKSFSKTSFKQRTKFTPCNLIWNGEDGRNNIQTLHLEFQRKLKESQNIRNKVPETGSKQFFMNPKTTKPNIFIYEDFLHGCKYLDTHIKHEVKEAA